MMLGQIPRFLDSVRKTVFIVGTALLIFVCARNSITWHMQKFWGASADFWQRRWEDVCNLCNNDHFTIGVYGTTCYTFLVFWFSNLFLMFVDLTGKPQVLLRYKIQPAKNAPVSKTAMLTAIKWVLINQLAVGLGFSVLVHIAYRWRGCSVSSSNLPSFHWAVLELALCVLFEEMFFYYSHRLLHHPWLYKYIHKWHHEWTAPIGIVSIYAHPLEHIMSNMIPPSIGPLLIGSHLATAWMWFTVAIMSTTISHCGYHFPFLPSPEAHDYHHLKFNQNFGVLGVLDLLHGTDAKFRASKAYERHVLSLSFTPMSQQVPDTARKGKSY